MVDWVICLVFLPLLALLSFRAVFLVSSRWVRGSVLVLTFGILVAAVVILFHPSF